MISYIFDVDGTLTPSRGQMDDNFNKWFIEFCHYTKAVHLVTGSDKNKTLEQVGEQVYNACQTVYQCSGNDVWQGEVNKEQNDWKLSEDACEWLNKQLLASTFPLRTGLHLEHRPGLMNFSVVGRNATFGERKMYVHYDKKCDERKKIADLFNAKFTDDGIVAQVAGETGLDIMPIGFGKEQILKDFPLTDTIFFFGDMTMPGGNDHDIAQAVRTRGGKNESLQVEGWQDTWNKLKNI